MKKIFSLFISLLFCFCLFSQPATSLLWKITGNNLQHTSYIYGTIHLMCPKDIVVTEALRSAFDSTRKLYLEINLDDPTVMFKTMQYMKMPGDTTLQMLLSKSTYDSVAASFKQVSSLPFSMISFIRPMLAESFIYPSLLGCEGAEAWEEKFIAMARENKDQVGGLEPVEEQIKIFTTIPLKEQADMLASSLLKIDSLKESFNQLLSAYRSKDQDLMLNNRKKKWITVIEAAIKQQSCFIAVGAGHLGGNDGVLKLLKKEGYKVEPVMY